MSGTICDKNFLLCNTRVTILLALWVPHANYQKYLTESKRNDQIDVRW